MKVDCNCTRRASNYVCKYCGVPEYASPAELRRLSQSRANCEHPDAPSPSPEERFKGLLGGCYDCLAPEAETATARGAA